MNIKSLTLVAAGALAMSAATVASGHAEEMKVSANLTPSSEVPPATAPKAKGEMSGTYDPSTKKLMFSVEYSGLTGLPMAAHLHAPAPTGKNSGIEIPIKGELESPIKGEYTLTEEQAKNLTDGDTYFNIHTKDNPNGELRGQILTVK